MTEMITTKPGMQAILGDGIALRLLTEHDLSRTLGWRNRDAARIQFKHAEKLMLADHKVWFERKKSLTDAYYFIVENKDDGQAVGQVAIYNINLTNQSAEVGTFIAAPEAEGRGFMKRAILALMAWAFKDLKLNRVYLEVFATNLRAIRIYESCGFSLYGQVGEMLLMQKMTALNMPESPASARV